MLTKGAHGYYDALYRGYLISNYALSMGESNMRQVWLKVMVIHYSCQRLKKLLQCLYVRTMLYLIELGNNYHSSLGSKTSIIVSF